MAAPGQTQTSTSMTWTKALLALLVLVAGCGAPPDSRSSTYSREISNEMPKGDDTPLFDPPPHVLERDGGGKVPDGG